MEVVETLVDSVAQLANTVTPPLSERVVPVSLSRALDAEVASVAGKGQAFVDGRFSVRRVEMQGRCEGRLLIFSFNQVDLASNEAPERMSSIINP